MKAKERMYQEARQYVTLDDGPGPITSQPTMQTIRTESGQVFTLILVKKKQYFKVLKTFTVQTVNSSTPIIISGSRQVRFN